MHSTYTIIIPARYASSRLPGKPLQEIKGKTLIQHVYETACDSKADHIYIATDDERIATNAESFGAEVVMTSSEHQSGTDRLAEVVNTKNISADEIVVNLQGDEYGLPVSLLNQVAECLANNKTKQMATLCEPIQELSEYNDPNIVKVVFNQLNSALYFSRSPIPANRAGKLPENAYRHIGLYAYRASFLETFTQLEPCDLEKTEALEQLRALHHGAEIHVEIANDKTGIGIDTMEDLERARTA